MQTCDPITTFFAPDSVARQGVPLILAPMAGVTDLPFRMLARRFGADWTVSEMIASQALIRGVPKCQKLAESGVEAGPLVVQIAGADPSVMAQAAGIQAQLGAAVIDINMGCPVRKIVNTGAGAALLQDELLAGRVMEAVVRAVKIPVSVKIRLGWDATTRNGVTIAKIAESAGIRCITVHGRTRAQMYTGMADWEAVGEIKSRVAIPVIGNGDIKTPEQARHWWQQTQVDGLMIGRAALGRPWIFQEIAHFLATGTHLAPPSWQEQFLVITDHFQAMLRHHGPWTGHLLARKHLAWFTKGFPGGALFRDRINHALDAEATLQLLHEFLARQTQMRAA